MDIKRIRELLRDGAKVVLIEEGQAPLIVSELKQQEQPQEVPIASRWPKTRSIHEGRGGEQVLERLNKEILALKEQIAQDEGSQEN